jgi:hypothetical protein
MAKSAIAGRIAEMINSVYLACQNDFAPASNIRSKAWIWRQVLLANADSALIFSGF